MAETVKLAVERHQDRWGARVTCDLREFPTTTSQPFKACIYRVVQEALSNAYQHSGGGDASVTAWMEEGRLRIVVRNERGQLVSPPESDGHRVRLGMLSISRRLAVFSGSAVLRPEPTGAELSVTLPAPEAPSSAA